MTVMPIDGIGAFDLISRRAVLQALMRIEGGPAVMPFVRMFYGQGSTYLWEDDEGVVHNIEQGEGGEQVDPMMPLLFALGQHAALTAIQGSVGAEERLMAFLDDLYVATPIPDRLRNVYGTMQQELWTHLPHSHQRRQDPGVEFWWSATRIL